MSGATLCHLTIAEAAPRIRSGTLSPVELTRAFLERIDTLNETLFAYVTVCHARALADAERAEQEIAGR